jgi:predicted nucleotidyltransferase
MSDALATILGGQTKARILDVLVSHPGESYHLRGLANAAGTDSGNTSKLLRSLVKMGLVLATRDSHSTRYSINHRSPLAAPLRQLIACAGSLMMDLRAVAEGIQAAYIGVFGSVASGTDDSDSDVDVLVVGDISGVTAQAAFKAVGRKHRRTVNAVAVTQTELAKRLSEGGAFWTSVAQGKRIDLKGTWTDVAISQPTAN